MKVVFASKDDDQDLFTANAMHDICRLEDISMQPYFPDLQTFRWFRNYYADNTTHRPLHCRSVSLPSFIQIILNKRSCYDITTDDVKRVKSLLHMCYPLYKEGALNGAQDETTIRRSLNRNSPSSQDNEFGFHVEDCYKNDVVFHMFQYTLDSEYIKTDKEGNIKTGKLKMSLLLTHTLQEMPLIEYFNNIFTKTLDAGSVKVVGFFRTLGRKLVIFSSFLNGDLWLFGVAITSVLCIMLAYMRSVILVLATVVNIVFSYTIAYFVYRMVLGIEYFPFINLLSGIMIIGKFLFKRTGI